MLRLMLSSIPVIRESAELANKRLRIRGLQPRKRLPSYLRGMSLALLRTVNRLSNVYVQALLIRGWSANPPPPERGQVSKQDLHLLIGVGIALAGILIINHL